MPRIPRGLVRTMQSHMDVQAKRDKLRSGEAVFESEDDELDTVAE